MKGAVFSVEEFSVYDGPGIRTTVFFAGCPLRCVWCHNPEGFTGKPKLLRTSSGCLHCGRCEAVCPHPDACVFCGECVNACPRRLIRLVGLPREATEIAGRVLRNAEVLTASGGGVTLSGGEVLNQPEFLAELLTLLSPIHRAIETCGCAPEEVFRRAISLCDLVLLDVKLTDPEKHRRYTEVDNQLILHNLEVLKLSGIPFTIRVPLIPGVNDDEENLRNTARLVAGCKTLTGVELLPYNHAAGAKYESQGLIYAPDFDTRAEVSPHAEVFTELGIACSIL